MAEAPAIEQTAAPAGRSGWARVALAAALVALLCALGSALLLGLMVVKRGGLDPLGLALLLATLMFCASGALFYFLSRPGGE